MKTLIQTSKVLILSIAVLMVMGYAQAAWDAPSGAPSELNNAPTPINVSNSQQDKAGKLTASVLGADSLCLTGDGCIEEWPGGGDVTFQTGIANITQQVQESPTAISVSFNSNFNSIPNVLITPKWGRRTGDEDTSWIVTDVTTNGFNIIFHTPGGGYFYGEDGVMWLAVKQ